jgi:hypothetical protein
VKKLTKLDISENPLVESAGTLQEYGKSVWDSLGQLSINDNHLSPNVGYWVAGDILEGPVVGESLKMMRHIRNGVEVPGLFHTSLVVNIDGDYFTTVNSLYKIENYRYE